MVTYRRFSHTDSMGYPRLERCPGPLPEGYQHGLAVVPVVLATQPCGEIAASHAVPSDITRLKAPTVPESPPGLPEEYDMCVQENGMFIRHKDTSHKLHGAQVSATCWTDEETGMRMCRIDVGGDAEMVVPGCVEEGVEKEPLPQICCVNAETSTLVCPGSAYDGLVVKIVHEFEDEDVISASVEHPDLPGGGARIPVCTKLEPEKEEAPCCIDEKTGQIQCPESSVLAMYHGNLIPDRYYECHDKSDGSRVCVLKCGVLGQPANETERFLQHICQMTGRMEFPVCEIPVLSPVPVPTGPDSRPRPEREPPKQLSPVPVPRPRPDRPKQLSPVPVPREPERVPVPQLCCLNPETSSLVCEGTSYDGLVVKVVHRTKLSDGTEIASVEHPSMPGGGARVPICPGLPPQRRPRPERPPTRRPPPPRREPPPPVVELPPEPEPRPREPEEPKPRPKLPSPSWLPNCCYNMETGLLECDEDSKWNGTAVNPVSIGHIQDGVGMILVEHPKFVSGRASVPICGGSCYPDADEGRAYAMTYSGTCPICTGPSLRRYAGELKDPFEKCHKIIDPWTNETKTICPKGGPKQIAGLKDPFAQQGGFTPPFEMPSRPTPPSLSTRPSGVASRRSRGRRRRYSGFNGRPSEVLAQIEHTSELDHRNRGFRPNSPGPNIHLLHQANLPPSPWGPVGHARPPNISGNPAGFNKKLFANMDDVANVLAELGYSWDKDNKFQFSKAVRHFQSDYNRISNGVASGLKYRDVNWVRVPRGNVVADGMVGPITMNALEIAVVNHRGGVTWEELVLLIDEASRGIARERIYSARGW